MKQFVLGLLIASLSFSTVQAAQETPSETFNTWKVLQSLTDSKYSADESLSDLFPFSYFGKVIDGKNVGDTCVLTITTKKKPSKNEALFVHMVTPQSTLQLVLKEELKSTSFTDQNGYRISYVVSDVVLGKSLNLHSSMYGMPQDGGGSQDWNFAKDQSTLTVGYYSSSFDDDFGSSSSKLVCEFQLK